MAFPNIITNRPVGTQMVSTIDDFERETRTWLRQCMIEISGYPDVNTIGIKGWTNSTRPSSNPNGKYLLGYNTQTGSLEVIGTNGSVVQSINNKSIALLAHPVGEYYWTSNTSFNPNTAWGGTWERIQDGRCLISNNGSHSVGSTGGSETVTLSKNNLPSISLEHNHGVGTYQITGQITSNDESHQEYQEYLTTADSFTTSGALSMADKVVNGEGVQLTGNFDATSWRTIKLKADSGHGFTGRSSNALTNIGGGTAHNNMQPYRTAICWHRTA